MDLELIPLIRSTNLSDEVYEELENSGFNFDDDDYIADIHWESNDSLFAKWLVNTYGNIIKTYSTFALKY